MRADDRADGASTSPTVKPQWVAGPQGLQDLAGQAEVLNGVALLSVTAPAEARQHLVRTLPPCAVHPSLTWVWHILLHHCGQRAHAIAVAETERICRVNRTSA